MLFTSAVFLLLFLPVTVAGFYLLAGKRPQAGIVWLLVASLFFYGYWMPAFALLLLASIGTNFSIGLAIAKSRLSRPGAARVWLLLGLSFNLGLLAYFKYFNFALDNLRLLTGFDGHWQRVILPIGISFYSFTQIAYLVDSFKGKASEPGWSQYGLFVTYFPHLIAGPVLHHSQMMPQFADPSVGRWRSANVAGGLAILAIGLVKKVVLADGVSPYADAVFGPTDGGDLPSLREAWLAAVAYTLQLYFDFSGYSDMAVGLSWIFNVRLPFNFDSPYRAGNISDFWRRWHISLSTFLRDYLYIPLGGNQRGEARRYLNLSVTMLLGGLWHGASWTFVVWGGLHGLYLMVNHGFRALLPDRVRSQLDAHRAYRLGAWAITLLAVVVAWVFFRAQTFGGAGRMLAAMVGSGSESTVDLRLWNAGLQFGTGSRWCLLLGVLAVLPRNSNAIGSALLQVLHRKPWCAALVGGVALSAVLSMAMVSATRDTVSAFIYFNF